MEAGKEDTYKANIRLWLHSQVRISKFNTDFPNFHLKFVLIPF